MNGWMDGLLSVLKKRNAMKVKHEMISAALLTNGWMAGCMDGLLSMLKKRNEYY